MKITALQPQTRHSDRYNLFLDGRFAFAVADTLVLSDGLSVGQELSAADVERLQTNEDERRLYEAALHFLAPRPRSRAEVRRRLLAPHPKRQTPTPEMVDRVLDRLQKLDLLNDQQFADFWVENRERFSPRSARALAQELRQRGVARETVEQVSEPDRDEERALAAGRQRLRALASANFETFRLRLSQFLLRRGFGYSVIHTAVNQLWEETGGGAREDDEDEKTVPDALNEDMESEPD